ncbi:class I SAM-dependent methyltransferase [Sesbania bispinosa]|nr:class I SAM-dependent methyltransferase [Sesbania bispinosa]
MVSSSSSCLEFVLENSSYLSDSSFELISHSILFVVWIQLPLPKANPLDVTVQKLMNKPLSPVRPFTTFNLSPFIKR